MKLQQNQDFHHYFKDGSIKLRKLRRSIENRLEIEDNVLTSWKISSGDRTDIRQKNDTRIIWNEEILTCSGNDISKLTFMKYVRLIELFVQFDL